MEPSNINRKKPARAIRLPLRIAELCTEEATSLTRPTGDGTVIPRQLDPNEKPRTTGARTAG